MKNTRVVISTKEIAVTAEKMLIELNSIKKSFEQAYLIAKENAKDDETLAAIRNDRTAAREICDEMEKFIGMMQYVSGAYSDCADNIRNMIDAIYI